jgi:P2-related tail formation protein
MDEPLDDKPEQQPLSQQTLNELLKRHTEEKDALRKEFEDSTNLSADVTSKNADKRIATLAPDAWTALSWLVNNADSESTRLSAAKYILDITMGKKLPGSQTSEDKAIEDLIESLRPKPS